MSIEQHQEVSELMHPSPQRVISTQRLPSTDPHASLARKPAVIACCLAWLATAAL